MDFGLDLVGIEGLVVGQNTSSTGANAILSHPSEQQLVLEGKPRSGSIKQERSDPYEDGANRVSKMAKRADDLGLMRSNDNAISLPKEQMLSFSSNSSSTKPEVSFLSSKDLGLISDKNAQNLAFSYYQQPSSYPKTPTGFDSGKLNGAMHGSFTGIRGPFTPAQWIELEHQAMIFKYFIANIPVPPNLLVPIRKALSSSGFPGFSVGSYPSHSYGWGSFHLGFSGSTDPEPGRCRRTDGKKWRCSRDAVPDQKYCERHINRGRHRSRKPVEGLTGQAASGPTTTTKGAPAISAAMSSLVTSSSGGASNTVTIAQHQIKGFKSSGGTNASTDPIVNPRFHDQQGLTVMASTMNLKSKDDPPFSILKQNIPLDESSQSEFGLVSTDSLLNPSQKGSYFSCKTYNSLLEFNAQQTQGQDQYPLRHFTADWPKDQQSNRSTLPWSEELKSDWTQLSMSIPMTSNFSSPSSPAHEKMAPSPLRLTRELDPSSQIGSGVGPLVGEMASKQNSRIPTPWVNSMGGPLGEVLLKNASNAIGPYKPENQRGDGWEDGSPQVGSSPTGVLQKSTFVSLSNSSSGGSSPRGESKKTQEGASLCDEPLNGLVTHASSNSIPSCKC